MTFHSLYRLEQRELLDCPIVGVAGDDWTIEQLRERARSSIEGCGESIDEQVFARLRRAAVIRVRRLRQRGHLRRACATRSETPSTRLLPGDPALAVRHGDRAPGRRRVDRWRPCGGREALRPRPRICPRARRGNPPIHRGEPALPDRPLPREDGHRRAAVPALRQHHDRADLEPQPHRVGADHDGRGFRRRGPRALLRPGRCAARRGRQPPDADRRGGRDGGARRQRRRDAQGRQVLAVPLDRGRRSARSTCAASTTAISTSTVWPPARRPRPMRRCAAHRQLALVGRPVVHPHGQAPAGHRRPSCGPSSGRRRG